MTKIGKAPHEASSTFNKEMAQSGLTYTEEWVGDRGAFCQTATM